MSVTIIKNIYKSSGFEPFEQTFTYTGAVQTLLIPKKGLYQLEVWGSKGGHTGGAGGYSKGYALLNKDTVLYICCGGIPYNGGGNKAQYSSDGAGDGGGATHIALVDGILRNIGYTSFVTNQNGLIVAGGGGGGASVWYGGSVRGGSGGGLSGGNGSSPSDAFAYYGTGGTQTGAGTALYSSDCAGGFGYGGNGNNRGIFRNECGAGGGGFYGGGGSLVASGKDSREGSGGGGSGWIGGVPELTYRGTTYTPSTENEVNNTTGKAKITRVV